MYELVNRLTYPQVWFLREQSPVSLKTLISSASPRLRGFRSSSSAPLERQIVRVIFLYDRGAGGAGAGEGRRGGLGQSRWGAARRGLGGGALLRRALRGRLVDRGAPGIE